MCLNYITKKYLIPRNSFKSKIGYKIYIQPKIKTYEDTIYSPYFYETVFLNKWYSAIPLGKERTRNGSYTPYYHLFPNIKEAQKWLRTMSKEIFTGTPFIYLVEYKGCTAIGTQDGIDVLIAKKIKVLGKVLDSDNS